MIPTKLPTETQGRRAFDALAHALASIPEEAIARPHTDPMPAAVTALLVADVSGATELRELARAIFAVLRELGGAYLPEDVRISPEIVLRGRDVRRSAIAALEDAFPDDAELRLWFDAVARGESAVDLVYDLRTLAHLFTTRSFALGQALACLPEILDAAADALEIALRAHETTKEEDARAALGRLWTLFVPAYERTCAAAPERRFPPLALVAAHRRRNRRTATDTGRYQVVAHAEIERSEPPPPPPRQVIELEVGVTSESNFYVGFTENMSPSGVFVATFTPQPIGSKVEIALTLPDGSAMRLPGVVRWIREPSVDAWPGIGVELERVPLADEERIRGFLALRDPIFHA